MQPEKVYQIICIFIYFWYIFLSYLDLKSGMVPVWYWNFPPIYSFAEFLNNSQLMAIDCRTFLILQDLSPRFEYLEHMQSVIFQVVFVCFYAGKSIIFIQI